MDDIDKFMEEQRDAILDHGFTVQYADAPAKSFQNLPRAHTVGRTLFNRPELLIVGPFLADQMHEMLSEAVAMDNMSSLEVGAVVDVDPPGRRFRVDEADPSALIGAMAAFGSIRALQLVWSRPDGTFPGEPQMLRPPGIHPLHPTSDPYGPRDPFKEDE